MALLMHKQVIGSSPGEIFISRDSLLHNGKNCKRVRALTKEDPNPELAKLWNVRVGMTVVQLDDGTEIAVHNDEVVGED